MVAAQVSFGFKGLHPGAGNAGSVPEELTLAACPSTYADSQKTFRLEKRAHADDAGGEGQHHQIIGIPFLQSEAFQQLRKPEKNAGPRLDGPPG